nr:hypothetical protein [Clostridium chromiireducens]
MNIPDTITHVNSKLKAGYSIAKIERELSFGKDTLRKKLNRADYFYDKILNQFIFQGNTDITQDITHTAKNEVENVKRYTENKVITNNATPNITHDKMGNIRNSENNRHQTQNITPTEKPPVTQTDNTDLTHKKTQRAITDEDFNILFEIIDNYKLKKNNINIPREDSEVTTRSFRSYKSILDKFATYCKDNQLNQKDAIADALVSYMSK